MKRPKHLLLALFAACLPVAPVPAAQEVGPAPPPDTTLLKHAQLGSGQLMLDDRGDLVGVRGDGRLTGRKACAGPFRLRVCVLVPEAAEVGSVAFFADAGMTRPWEIDGEAVEFSPDPAAGAWAQRDIMSAPPGARWHGFLSNPLQPGAARDLASDYSWVASMQGYPGREALGEHSLAMLIGTVEDGLPAGDNLLYLYWTAYGDGAAAPTHERRSYGLLAALVSLAVVGSVVYLRLGRPRGAA